MERHSRQDATLTRNFQDTSLSLRILNCHCVLRRQTLDNVLKIVNGLTLEVRRVF